MAGDWIKWVKGLTKKPEIVLMASTLKKSRREVAAMCMEFWEWCDENISEDTFTPNGSAFVKLSPLDDDNLAFIDALVGTAKFADSLTAVDWLRCRDGRIELPGFALHNGQTAKTRARNAKNQKSKRQSDEPESPPKKTARRSKMSPPRDDKNNTREREREECITSDEVIHPLNPPAGESVGECLDSPEVPASGIADIGQPIGESHPHITCLRVGGIKGDVIAFDEAPDRWVAEFIRLWNKLSGVSKHTNKALDSIKYRELCHRLRDTDWDWKAAFLKFPLRWPVGTMPTLSWFLKPDSVSKILDGMYATTGTTGATEGGLFSRRATGPSEATRIRTGETAAHVAACFAQAGQVDETGPERGQGTET